MLLTYENWRDVMANVTLSLSMSLDGFVAGPNDEIALRRSSLEPACTSGVARRQV
ncbi:MAG: hypothetical protein ACRDWI_18625 [Jiangellaceae bacterium]